MAMLEGLDRGGMRDWESVVLFWRFVSAHASSSSPSSSSCSCVWRGKEWKG